MKKNHRTGLKRVFTGSPFLFVVVALTFIAMRSGAVAGEASSIAIKVGLLPPFPFYWASYVAEQKGLFKDERLNVEIIQLSRPSEAVQALVGGSLNFAWVSADAFINANEAGASVPIIAQAVGNPAFSVIVQPGIKSWSEVKGKTVAVSAPKDGAAILFRLMAHANGLRESDYTFISVGTTPNRYAALKSRAVDVAIMGQPQDFVAVKEGFRMLGRSDTVLKNYAFIMIGTNKAWAEGHRDEVLRYLTVLRKAVDWLHSPANKSAAVDVLLKGMRRGERETMEKIYSIYFEEGLGKIITRGAEVDVEGLRVFGQKLKELDILKRDPDPARWTDLSYQRAAAK
ncbi:MAG: ABC transporter substrate-binding protein [Deltaproteobacteria bacterium]|nr:ABC transporter substrate-binding protein [Deltaproteobacteria bacterium]